MNEENRLKSGLAAGDAASYRDAYGLYGAALFRSALRILGNRADAEDAVQEVFAAMVRSRERIGQVADLKAYIFASLRNTAIRLGQKRQRQGATGLKTVGLTASVEKVEKVENDGGFEAEKLWQLVGRLPEEQRAVLALKIHGELTFEQIGEVFGISPNTAASRYRYALQKLKQMMESKR